MPYTLDFIVNKQVIYQKITGVYTLEDLRQACSIAALHMDTMQIPCYVVSDLSLMTSFPTNVGLARIAAKPAASHPNLAMTISYGLHNPIGNFVFNTIAGIFKIPAKIFAAENIALAYLEKDAPEIASGLQTALFQLKKRYLKSA